MKEINQGIVAKYFLEKVKCYDTIVVGKVCEKTHNSRS